MAEPEPPAAIGAERAYLATILRSGALGADDLAVEEFYHPAHRATYRAIAGLGAEGEEISLVTVADRLEREGQLEAAGGAGALADLVGAAADAPWARSAHAKLIREKARLRRIQRLAWQLSLTAAASDPEGRMAEEAAQLAEAVYGEWQRRREALTADELDARFRLYATTIDQARIPTGIGDLDRAIGGVGAGQVLTVLARTGVGKSAISQNVVEAFLARGTEGAAVIASAEMPSEEVFLRQLQIHGDKREGDVIAAYRAGATELVDRSRFLASARERLLVIPEPHLTLAELEAMTRLQARLGRIQPPRLMVLDYLGLFDAGRQKASDVERYGEVAKGAKVLAKRLAAAVILIVQASRSAKGGGAPISMTDARNSGEIEESADFLVGAWRPVLDEETKRRPELRRRLRRVMCWRLLKARRSKLEEFVTAFDPTTLRVAPATADELAAAAEWRELCRAHA